MKRIVTTCLLCFLFVNMLCAQGIQNMEAKAKEMLEWIKQGEGEKFWNECSPEVQSQITPMMFAKMWRQLEGQVGKYESEGEMQTGIIGGIPVYYSELKFEHYTLRYTIVFNEEDFGLGIHSRSAHAPTVDY